MNALKKVFRPGSAWVRVNHRFPDREGGRILAPAGTPVRCQVERVLSDSVVFKLERGDISYLSWPSAPLQVKVSPDTVEISDDHGALLTYTKAPAISESDTVTLVDFLQGFMLLRAKKPWWIVLYNGERVGSVMLSHWSTPAKASLWLKMAHDKMPFDRSVTNFRDWMKDVVSLKLMPEFPMLPPPSRQVPESEEINPAEVVDASFYDPQMWMTRQPYVSDTWDWHSPDRRVMLTLHGSNTMGRNSCTITYGNDISYIDVAASDLSWPEFLKGVKAATRDIAALTPERSSRQAVTYIVRDHLDIAIKRHKAAPTQEAEEGEQDVDADAMLTDYVQGTFTLKRKPDAPEYGYDVFFGNRRVGDFYMPYISLLIAADTFNWCHRRMPYDPSTNFSDWYLRAVSQGLVEQYYKQRSAKEVQKTQESEDIDFGFNPQDVIGATPSAWMQRIENDWWVWPDAMSHKVRVCLHLNFSEGFYAWTVLTYSHSTDSCLILKRDISQTNFVSAIHRACKKVEDYLKFNPKTTEIQQFRFADKAVRDELKGIQEYSPAYDSNNARRALSKTRSIRYKKESMVHKIVDNLLEGSIGKAAVRLKDGRIFTGPIHAMAISDMQDQGVLDPEEKDLESELRTLGAEFGWLDDQGRFLTRRQAYRLAVAAGQVPDVYGPHKGLTHDMLDKESQAWEIGEGMTFSGSMPMFTLPERIVRRLLQEEDDEDFGIIPSDVTTNIPDTWMERIPQDGEDEGGRWHWWKWAAPDRRLLLFIYACPDEQQYVVLVRDDENHDDWAGEERLDVLGMPSRPVRQPQFMSLLRAATQDITARMSDEAYKANPIQFATAILRQHLKPVLSESEVEPDEFLADFMRNRWSCRTKSNMGTPETWFYYGNKFQGYDTMPKVLSNWYVELLNWLTKSVGFNPSEDPRMPGSITDPRNVIHKYLDTWAHLVVPWMERNPVKGAYQPNLRQPQAESAEPDEFFSPDEFFKEWKGNPWRFEVGEKLDKQYPLRFYFLGNLVHTHWMYGVDEAEPIMRAVRNKHEKVPYLGGSFMAWYLHNKNEPKVRHQSNLGGWRAV